MRQSEVWRGPEPVECEFSNHGQVKAAWEKIKPLCDSIGLSSITSERSHTVRVPRTKEDDLKVAFDEVVKNVLEHGGGRGKVTANVERGVLIKIVVTQDAPGIPAPISETLQERGKRGLNSLAAVPLALIETPDDHFFHPAVGGGESLLSPPEKGMKVTLWQTND